MALLVGFGTGCSILTPGKEGWQCKTSEDCHDGLRCRTYQFKGRDHSRRYCTGRKALTSNSQTYNWFVLIAAWAMIAGLPLLVLGAVIVKRIRARKKTTSGEAAGS